MKILVTGATGFIGSHLIPRLQDDHEVFALIHRVTPRDFLRSVRWIEQDLTQALDHRRLPRRVDAVIHLAQSRFYKRFPDRAEDIFHVNIHGTFQLLEYARLAGTECFVFASSGGVYGHSYERFVETDPVNPLTFYFSSKYSAELLIANYQQFFRTVVFRYFFVYGPGQRSMLIPKLLQKVLNAEAITIEGNPGLRINPIYVDDATRVFEPALHLRTSDLFNVAGDEHVTITELVKSMEKVGGRQSSIKHTESSPQGDLVGDNTRMKEVLGVHPKVSLYEGLSRIIEVQSAQAWEG